MLLAPVGLGVKRPEIAATLVLRGILRLARHSAFGVFEVFDDLHTAATWPTQRTRAECRARSG